MKNKNQLESGWELLKEFVEDEKKTDEEEIQRISLSRTNKRIRELAKCNHFEYFGTITINGYYNNRYELDDCQTKLKKILRRIHDKTKGKLKYLIITEKHKDGAFHFHGLFSGLDLSLNDYGYFYNEDLQELGYNSFSLIKDYNKTCNYICKYITKDCVKNSHNQIFMRSKGLNVATHEEIKNFNYNGTWKYENDFCCITDIDLNNLTDEDKNLLMAIINSNPKLTIFDKMLNII